MMGRPPGARRRYRYSTTWGGVSGTGLSVQPVGLEPAEQNRFHTEVNLIARTLYGRGAALDEVYTSHSFAIFQSQDARKNRLRAQRVMAEWRRLTREGVNIIAVCRGRLAAPSNRQERG